MRTTTFAQAQARYDAMEPPDDPPDLTEMSDDDLYNSLALAEDSATDPEVPAGVRHRCDEACLQIMWEIARRRREEDRT
jgi:hypothetical protein